MNLKYAKNLLREQVYNYIPLVGYRHIQSISFWLTYRCVHDCDYCLCPGKSGFMEKKRYYAVMEEALPMGLLSAGFTGGDPSLHPDFEELLDHAMNCGLTHVALAS